MVKAIAIKSILKISAISLTQSEIVGYCLGLTCYPLKITKNCIPLDLKLNLNTFNLYRIHTKLWAVLRLTYF